MDLAIDEVTHISTLIQEEAGEDAEIIFGAVHDPAMSGKVRVTVIATGFEAADEEDVIRPDFRRASSAWHQRPQSPRVRGMPQAQPARQVAVANGGMMPVGRLPERPDRHPDGRPVRVVTRERIEELDIPTFIRRQMD